MKTLLKAKTTVTRRANLKPRAAARRLPSFLKVDESTGLVVAKPRPGARVLNRKEIKALSHA